VAIDVPVEHESNGRRSVAGILAEIQSQRARYLAAMQGHEAETRHLLAKMAALDAVLDSSAAQPGTKDVT
tara:strand:- start:166 stop:375 length:210 start_codon:yes stop_codon:yes gene_type:complete